MRHLLTLTRKELSSYFQSPIAYVVIAIFLVLSGLIFADRLLWFSRESIAIAGNPYMMENADLNVTVYVLEPLFFTLNFLSLLMIPMLTMRSFSEEKKSGAIELLFTYPVRDIEVTAAKFLACFAVYFCMLVFTAAYPALTARFAAVELSSVAMGYAGLLLSGAAFIALGIFISSLTENQIIAVAGGYGLLLLFWLAGAAKDLAPEPYNAVLGDLSLFDHMEDFARGIFNTHDLVYYLLFSVFFLFLTLRWLEVVKWRGRA